MIATVQQICEAKCTTFRATCKSHPVCAKALEQIRPRDREQEEMTSPPALRTDIISKALSFSDSVRTDSRGGR